MSNPSLEITIQGPSYEEVSAYDAATTYDAAQIKANVIQAVGFAVNDVILTNIATQAVSVYEHIVAKAAAKGLDVEKLYKCIALLAVIILLVEWLLAIKSFLCENVQTFICDLPNKVCELFSKCEDLCSPNQA